jgi:hypothetical protein
LKLNNGREAAWLWALENGSPRTLDKESSSKKSTWLTKGAAMSHGGRRNGAGRPKGAISLDRRALIAAAQAGGEMPIAYMLRVMRDENVSSTRRDSMAKAAAAYLYSRTPAARGGEHSAEADPIIEAVTPEQARDNR